MATPRKSAPKTPAKRRAPAKPKAPAAKAQAARAQSARTVAQAKPRLGLFSALAVGLVAAGSLATLFGRRLFAPGNAEHAAPDLALDQPHPGPDHRAPIAFRPDPTAPVPASEREGLRPATGPLPSLVTH